MMFLYTRLLPITTLIVILFLSSGSFLRSLLNDGIIVLLYTVPELTARLVKLTIYRGSHRLRRRC